MKPPAMLTRSQLARTLAHVLEMPLGSAELVVTAIINSMTAALQRGERIEIRGFGGFHVDTRPPRTGRNPRTGDSVQVGAKKIVRFRAAQAINEALVGKHAITELHDEDRMRLQPSPENRDPLDADQSNTNTIAPACCGVLAAQRTRLLKLLKQIGALRDTGDGALLERVIREKRKIEGWLASHSHASERGLPEQ